MEEMKEINFIDQFCNKTEDKSDNKKTLVVETSKINRNLGVQATPQR